MALENTAAARLDYCAHALKTADIKWYGVHPPSTIVEELNADIVKGCSFVTDDLNILGTDQRLYSSIRVSKRELRELLKRVRQGEV